MSYVIAKIPSTKKKGTILEYLTIQGEKIPDEVLALIAEQGNCYPYLALCYLEAKKSKKVLEFGICYARGTRSLLFGCKENDGHLWSIDWGSGDTPQYVALIEQMGLSKWFTWVQKDAFKLPIEWYSENKVDLIFVDIDDCNYNRVIDLCVSAMHVGSVLLFHNLDAGRGENESYLKYANNQDFTHEEYHTGHGMGILRKIK